MPPAVSGGAFVKLLYTNQYVYCPHSSTCKYSLPPVNDLGQGPWSLNLDKYWTISETSLITAMLQVFIFGSNYLLLNLVLQHWIMLLFQQLADGVGTNVGCVSCRENSWVYWIP